MVDMWKTTPSQKTLRVAAIQLESQLGNLDRNVSQALRMVDEAGKQETKLAVLPELSTTGFCLGEDFMKVAESIPGPTTTRFAELAKRHQMHIICGLPEKGEMPGVIYNTVALIDPAGNVAGRFRKLHVTLYLHTTDFLDEEREIFRPGNELPVFRTTVGNLGMLICQDGDYPEPYRVLTLKGAEIIAVSVNTPRGFEEMWWKLYCVHAYMNGCFIIACNKVGDEHYKFEGKEYTAGFFGGSYIAGPFGQIMAKGGEKEEVVYADIDPSEVARARWSTKLLRDFRPELYNLLSDTGR
jgi:predicted amidohydrolase